MHYVGEITQVENVYWKNVQLAIDKLAYTDFAKAFHSTGTLLSSSYKERSVSGAAAPGEIPGEILSLTIDYYLN